MVASNARKMLTEENELLNKLADTASQFAKSRSGFSAKTSFTGWRNFADTAIPMKSLSGRTMQ